MATKDLKVRLQAEGADQFKREVEKGSGAVRGLQTLAMAGGMIIAQAFGSMVRAVRNSFGYIKDLYNSQVKADNVLMSAIKATGESVDALMPKYRALAAEIQNVTAVGDEQTQFMIATATNMGVSSDKMNDFIKGAVGLSRTLRDANGETMDYASAVKYLILAQGGEVTMLQRYMPELRTLATQEEKLALINRKMVDGWKQAQEETSQTSVKVQQLKNDFGDMIQNILLGATRTASMNEAMDKMREIIKNIDTDKIGQDLANTVRDIADALNSLDVTQIASDINEMTTKIIIFSNTLKGIREDLGMTTRVLGEGTAKAFPLEPRAALEKGKEYASMGPAAPVKMGLDLYRGMFEAIDAEAIRRTQRAAARIQQVEIVAGGPQ